MNRTVTEEKPPTGGGGGGTNTVQEKKKGDPFPPEVVASLDGTFTRPAKSDTPVTILRLYQSEKWSTSTGKMYERDASKMRDLGRVPFGPGVYVCSGPLFLPDSWSAEFAGPKKTPLAVGIYRNARRYPFNEDAPGINITADKISAGG